jgi:hypothetical protein
LKKWKNRDKTSKFCHNGSRFCLIFFNNKRRRHTLLHIVFFSAEKRNGTVLKQPHYGTAFAFFRIVPPLCNHFLLVFEISRPCIPCNLACAGQHTSSCHVLSCQSGFHKGNRCTALCQLWKKTQRGASSSSKGWGCFPKTYSGDERMRGGLHFLHI